MSPSLITAAVSVAPEPIGLAVGSRWPKGASDESALIHSPVVTFVGVSSVPLANSASPGLMAAPVMGECEDEPYTVPVNDPLK